MYHRSVLVVRHLPAHFQAPVVGSVHVPVDKIFWMVFFKQFVEDLESAMGQIFTVVKFVGRGVGYKNVKAFMLPKFSPEFVDALAHVFFSILMRSVII